MASNDHRSVRGPSVRRITVSCREHGQFSYTNTNERGFPNASLDPKHLPRCSSHHLCLGRSFHFVVRLQLRSARRLHGRRLPPLQLGNSKYSEDHRVHAVEQGKAQRALPRCHGARRRAGGRPDCGDAVSHFFAYDGGITPQAECLSRRKSPHSVQVCLLSVDLTRHSDQR